MKRPIFKQFFHIKSGLENPFPRPLSYFLPTPLIQNHNLLSNWLPEYYFIIKSIQNIISHFNDFSFLIHTEAFLSASIPSASMLSLLNFLAFNIYVSNNTSNKQLPHHLLHIRYIIIFLFFSVSTTKAIRTGASLRNY